MRDIAEVMAELKAAPYTEKAVVAPHTGVVQFSDVEEGSEVFGPTGEWQEIPGTHIATITRERNPRNIVTAERGILRKVCRELDGTFVEAGTMLALVRHYLTRQEVISRLLMESLYTFCAPERARYYFAPDVDKKVKILGCRTVSVQEGMELFIVSRMKREAPLCYAGPSGIIYEVCFDQNRNVDAGAPLIVVCPPEQEESVEDVISRVEREWSDGE
ncbi:biotin attachment protein [uncultured Mailhella sp.]|uniref:biotin attachment protein n=1 Tax=uncultured Mailhella sp. TaxID=1981031 RepID=UPI00261E5168|nr:biotin attachment protein [uncultured Mailhella sp.]